MVTMVSFKFLPVICPPAAPQKITAGKNESYTYQCTIKATSLWGNIESTFSCAMDERKGGNLWFNMKKEQE